MYRLYNYSARSGVARIRFARIAPADLPFAPGSMFYLALLAFGAFGMRRMRRLPAG